MNVEEIDIKIIPETLMLTRGNMITGEIYFTTKSDAFPEKEWRDFVVVILTWWYDAIINILKNKQNEMTETLYFMDGPFMIKAVIVSDDLLTLNFIERVSSGEQIVFTINTSINEFKNTLLRSGNELLIELNERGWYSDDIDAFKVRHQSLLNI